MTQTLRKFVARERAACIFALGMIVWPLFNVLIYGLVLTISGSNSALYQYEASKEDIGLSGRVVSLLVISMVLGIILVGVTNLTIVAIRRWRMLTGSMGGFACGLFGAVLAVWVLWRNGRPANADVPFDLLVVCLATSHLTWCFVLIGIALALKPHVTIPLEQTLSESRPVFLRLALLLLLLAWPIVNGFNYWLVMTIYGQESAVYRYMVAVHSAGDFAPGGQELVLRAVWAMQGLSLLYFLASHAWERRDIVAARTWCGLFGGGLAALSAFYLWRDGIPIRNEAPFDAYVICLGLSHFVLGLVLIVTAFWMRPRK